MNIALNRTTDDLPPRRHFTAEDIRRMIDSGVISESERIELIEGEIVVMSAKSVAHDNIKNALLIAFARAVPDGLYVSVESTLQLADDILVEPDIAIISQSVYRADPKSFARPNSQDVLLLVEVAVSSIAYDRNVKAHLYARHGIREFWLVDANERIAWIYAGPSDDGWSSVVERKSEEPLTTSALPNFMIKLCDII
jgi:Uma2 family endonuclease